MSPSGIDIQATTFCHGGTNGIALGSGSHSELRTRRDIYRALQLLQALVKRRFNVAGLTTNIVGDVQASKAEAFSRLHVPGDPVVLYNVWDAGSAQTVAKAGAKAIATSSWAVAKAHGSEDGERIPYEDAIRNLREIAAAVDLPVSFDLESGYGETPEAVSRSISLAIGAGAIGCNIEDRLPGTGSIRDALLQAARIRSARRAASESKVSFFINARTDLFFQGPSVPHDEALLARLIERSHAYAEAGASGLFVPGLAAVDLIAELTKQSSLPINILTDSPETVRLLADIGVARISYGAGPYIESLRALEQAARAALN
ncbi:isocitrate lyase/phosphoenolpyruvate mutase family protein [Acidipila sp. EB88]|uniref:isocitrate lyase/PEP mutase family protein n=1 Tax=Acidipila sp. EB88 TaxID=2305226 RepID=UPI000F5D77EC|nr:isocitrate lyase/phosphoenolpyruvate mutase family protein [Acidipila sp. EB88]RRA49267.1 isocitrate lyase/phosphoenolpyruvate mutase family protein [Acidipila sp. EB88]